MRRAATAAAALALVFGITLGAAPSPSAAPSAQAILARMLEKNPALSSYRARVHVKARMLNFPWFAPKLDGTSYFKRPANYEVVFDRVPSYAKGFERLFDDVGDPSAWEKTQNVVLDSVRELNGRPTFVLRMTKKIHSDTVAYTLAYVDAQSYTVAQMEWHYTNGGHIVMTQQFRNEGPYTLISSQHVAIDIPHVRAVADAAYDAYQTNVAVDDGVFTK